MSGCFIRLNIILLIILAFCAVAYTQNHDKMMEDAVKYFNTGSYEMAEKVLTQVVNETKGKKGLEKLIDLYILKGKYEQALEIAKKMCEISNNSDKGKIYIGEILMLTGKYEKAKEIFFEIYANQPDNLRCRLNLGLYYFTIGDKKKYIRYFSRIFDEYDPYKNYSARDLTLIAKACRIYAMKSNEVDRSDTLKTIVQDILPDAIKKDKYFFPAYYEMADIFLSAFNTVDAQDIIDEALALNQQQPGILYCKALLQTHNRSLNQSAVTTIQHALAINPNYVECLDALAALNLADEKYEDADKFVQRALKVNPNSLTALSLLSASYYMQNREIAYNNETKKVLSINPNYGELYYTVSEIIGHKRQFDESVYLLQKAVKLDPFLWRGYISLGTNLMRIGKIDQARKFFKKVQDEYNFHVQTHNMLLLLEKYKEFKTFSTKHFKIRIHVKEADALKNLVEEKLENAFATLTKRYNFVPETPVYYELLPTHKDFSVRTIGLDSLGASGACFGKVITQVSPQSLRLGYYNWASVAWHEFAHVITLQLTNFKIPRWFTEGLSEYTEKVRNPSCKRKLDLYLFSAYSAKQMRHMKDLNEGFTRPKYVMEIAVCYYQAELICEFITKNFGFDKIMQMLLLYKQGKKDDRVFKITFDMTLAEFDKIFINWIKKNIFAKMNVFPTVSKKNLDYLKDVIVEKPKDIDSYLKLAIGYFKMGKFLDAQIYAAKLLKLSPKKPVAYDIFGRIAYYRGNYKKAKKMLEKAIKLGSKNFYTNLTLGKIYWKYDKNIQKSIQFFQQAKESYPNYVDKSNPYQILAILYNTIGKKQKAYEELESYLKLNGKDFKTRLKLGKEFFEQKKYTKSLTLLEQAQDIYPLSLNLQNLLAENYEHKKNWYKAIRAYKIILAMDPKKNKHEIYANLAQIYLKQNKFDQARSNARESLGFEPGFKKARLILEKLKNIKKTAVNEVKESKNNKIDINVYETKNPAKLGEETVYVIILQNTTNKLYRNIRLTLKISDKLKITYFKTLNESTKTGNEIKISVIKTLLPKQKLLFMVYCTPMKSGIAKSIFTAKYSGKKVVKIEKTQIKY